MLNADEASDEQTIKQERPTYGGRDRIDLVHSIRCFSLFQPLPPPPPSLILLFRFVKARARTHKHTQRAVFRFFSFHFGS